VLLFIGAWPIIIFSLSLTAYLSKRGNRPKSGLQNKTILTQNNFGNEEQSEEEVPEVLHQLILPVKRICNEPLTPTPNTVIVNFGQEALTFQ